MFLAFDHCTLPIFCKLVFQLERERERERERALLSQV